MKTEFVSQVQKFNLIIKIKNGDDIALNLLINEISRLESIIRDYEIGLEQASTKLGNSLFKRPHSTLQ